MDRDGNRTFGRTRRRGSGGASTAWKSMIRILTRAKRTKRQHVTSLDEGSGDTRYEKRECLENAEEEVMIINHQSRLLAASRHAVLTSKALSSRRAQLKLIQFQQSHELENTRNKLQFVDESIAYITRSQISQIAEEPDGYMARGLARLTADWKAFSDQWEAMLNVENSISTKQSQIGHIETKLSSALDVLVSEIPGGKAIIGKANAETVEMTTRTSSVASQIVPEVARTFFEKSGEVVALEDSLINLELDYIDERRRRDFERDQERPPSTPDTDFEHQFQIHRQELHSQLAQANSHLEHLRLQCEKEGIDLHSFGAQPADESEAADSNGTPGRVAPTEIAVIEDEHGGGNDPDVSNSAIEGWLNQLHL
ncbi:hypothetical protein AC579_9251 [Pseudocercospora musae]|uniref:Uncharacterized protein n=1 Tax=Pseudocercospora musae TaxID=113226 RepID=A0A139IHX4_9PEZI|nr:hypothetical protein AC579_9251 [Pseudocercospora musae]